MSDAWYEEVEPSENLTQGDIIENCPILEWSDEPPQPTGPEGSLDLESRLEVIEADVIIMTQACDLEQNKVTNVVMCPHFSLSEFRQNWEADMQRRNQNTTARSWSRYCNSIVNGQIWNLTMLNNGSCETLTIEQRVVDFSRVYTNPRNFLESFLAQQGNIRLRLRPPYREHLSQAFARYFMRVGLPVGVTPNW